MPFLPRDNPFEPLSPAALARIYEWPPEGTAFVAGESDCLHIVADCGMGKTTLLRQLEQRFAGTGTPVAYACVPTDGVLAVEPLLSSPVALLDETDRLSRRALQRLLRSLRDRKCRAALAGHRDQCPDIRRAGLSVAFAELRPLTCSEAAGGVFCRRVALALGSEVHPFTLTRDAKEALLLHSGGNLERIVQLGYEVFEDLTEARAITRADVDEAAAALTRATRGVEG